MAHRIEDGDGGTAALVFLFCICDVSMSGTIGGAIIGIEVWRYGGMEVWSYGVMEVWSFPPHSRSVHMDELWMSNRYQCRLIVVCT